MTPNQKSMHRQILQIALPSIVSNITVPLLALVDTTIVGHLGAASYIGAIAVGGMLFNMTYWLFGFLRMGTGGMTAQAYGAQLRDEAECVLLRSLLVAVFISLLLILFQKPLVDTAFHFVSATPEVERLARVYYMCLIWGAPAVLTQYSFLGWFLGMQNARIPMYVAIVQNVVNIGASLFLVLVLGWKVEGVAMGTLVAQYAGAFVSAACWYFLFRRKGEVRTSFGKVMNAAAFKRFFVVNRDIFLRTLCLIAVTTYFTSAGSAQGELALAANTLLMQFFILFSYVMDGFAYAGEALGGSFFGATDLLRFRTLTRSLFGWGMLLTMLFTLVYLLFGEPILALLTDEGHVISTAVTYLPFAVAIPLISFSAFLFDGLFIGTTSTRYLLVSMATAAVVFFAIVWIFPAQNAMLWVAFLTYLGVRGVVQALLYPKVVRKLTANIK